LAIAFAISTIRTLDLTCPTAPTLKLALVRFCILVLVGELIVVLVGELIVILVGEAVADLVGQLVVAVILLGRTLVSGFRLTLGPVDNLAGIVVQGDADIQFLPAEQDVASDVDCADR
jgi:hypothetical protein